MPFPPTMRATTTGWRRCAASARRSTSACRATTSCWLLGHGRRPAVQDPQQPEHPGHLPPARRCSSRRSIPAMLARAAAAGLDVGAIVSGLNQPLPLVRFQLLVQKAAEIVPGGQSRWATTCSRRWRRRTARRWPSCAPSTSASVLEMVEHVQVRPAAGGDQVEGGLAAVAGAAPCSATPTTSGSWARSRRDREGDPRARRAGQRQPGQDEVRA